VTDLHQLFSESGPLARTISGFRARPPQIEMAAAVEGIISRRGALLVEAGTGTGKTFAYLVPAMLTDGKVVISTGSKNLQEQLFHRDLPLVAKALGYRGPLALLKGRANYLCLERLNRLMNDSDLQHPQVLAQLVQVRQWSRDSRSGDVGEIPGLAEDAEILPYITSTNENCLGRECPCYEECYLVKARKQALDARLVVVNHHLFFADMALKDTGFGELVPDADLHIFDEAHQLPDIAATYFGKALSSRQLNDWARDAELLYRTELKDMPQLGKALKQLHSQLQQFRLVLGGEQGKGNWRERLREPATQAASRRLEECFELLYQVFKLALGRCEQADNLFERITELRGRWNELKEVERPGFSYWYEYRQRYFSINLTPLSVANQFGAEMERRRAAWVFTSATLSVAGSFGHFIQLMGLDEAQTLALDSPFDYPRQGVFCVPRGLPEPSAPGMADCLVQHLAPVIEASRGRCFFLCTSHQMMHRLAEGFRQRLSLPVLVQGEQNKQLLLSEFVERGNCLLIATGSFWEGVDVRGQALSCVIIDKLPFAAPDDPLLRARMENARLLGKEPFAEVQLPQAVIALKQGVGRLIRDYRDRGALVICDNRLVTRPYGQVFVGSLPPMARTRDLSRVRQFLTQLN